MIELKSVFVKYNRAFYALYDININFETGDKVVILGDSQCGKSSLLKVLVGLKKPEQGCVCIDGEEISGVIKSIPTLYIPEKGVFFNFLSVYRNLKWATRQYEDAKGYDIDLMLSEVGLLGVKNEKVKNITAYQKFMLACVRGILKNPQLIVIDDVFKSFSAAETESALEFIQKNFEGENRILVMALANGELATRLNYTLVKLNSGSIQK